MIKLIIFDFDGVIISGSNEGYFQAYHYALESVGVSFDAGEEKEKILSHWGTGHIDQLKYLLKDHPDKVEKATIEWESYFAKHFKSNLKLINGSKNALRLLSKEYRLAIISGAHKDMILQLLQENDIECFSEVVSSYDFEDILKRKPSPFAINMLIEKYNLNPAEVLSIGDDASDVKMARQAGVIPVVVLTGNLDRAEAEKLEVAYIFSSIVDIPQFVDSLGE